MTAARQQMQHGWEAWESGWSGQEWMRWVCLDVWVSGQVARAVDATPDCRNVKRSGIRRLSLTRDMRHGRVGVGGLCAAFREAATCVVCYVCCGLDDLISGWDGLQCASINLVGRGQDRFVGRTSSNSSLQHVAVARHPQVRGRMASR